MCGRYVVSSPYKKLAKHFGVEPPEETPGKRYNAAPTQELPVITAESPTIEMMRWGLIPFWAKDKSIGTKLINARAETLVEKPSFRTSFRKRRGLVASDGFYEWKKTAHGKVPMFIHLASGEPFAIAGLWDEWNDPESGATVRSFTIITTEPNEMMADIHNRMPAILRREDEKLWLDPHADEQELLYALRPFPAEEMEAWPVSTVVNNPKNDDPSLIEPMPEE